MANSTKLAFLAVAVLLLQASWCAVVRPDHDPDPCGDSALLGHKDHRCSSPAATSVKDGFHAVMVVTSFEPGQDGGGPAACDEQYHNDGDLIAAVSTEEYAGGSRCFKPIRIWNSAVTTSVLVNVVDAYDCESGCIATSKAVWDSLLLDTNIGEVAVTWADE